MIVLTKGNLLTSDADVICQQVNCQNVMGAGLAREIYTKWPDVKELYHEFCDNVGDPYALLGRVQIVRPYGAPFFVANIFGQLNYGRQKVCYTSYGALEAAFNELHHLYDCSEIIAFPHGFGCGLAGGDWHTVLGLIDKCFVGRKVKIYSRE